jgi:sigma-B regulation protein RsbU (phosphoserine phosphatase)
MQADPSADARAWDHAACGLARTADDGTFLRVNRTLCDWLGVSAEALVGRRRFQDLLTMGGRIFHQTHWSPLLRMQGSVSEVKLEVVHADGSLLPIVFNAVRWRDGDTVVHDLAAFVARDRDRYERELVESRKRLEVLVAEAKQHQAEARDRAVLAEQMIGIVSHDLRNPLAAIAMAVTVLTHGSLSPAQQRMIEPLKRSTDRARRLVSDLLDFTQARLGRGIPVQCQPIDLHAVVAQTVDELRPLHANRTLVHTRAGEGACTADPHRLDQVIGNLVSNAMTYGARDLPVTVRSEIEPTAFVLSVHNHGDPIPGPMLAGLFQPMTRGTDVGSAHRSVGLGLFIVDEIVRAHGGVTFVRSTAEAGTTFGARFPRARPGDPSEAG